MNILLAAWPVRCTSGRVNGRNAGMRVIRRRIMSVERLALEPFSEKVKLKPLSETEAHAAALIMRFQVMRPAARMTLARHA
jgi:hypothetical protein